LVLLCKPTKRELQNKTRIAKARKWEIAKVEEDGGLLRVELLPSKSYGKGSHRSVCSVSDASRTAANGSIEQPSRQFVSIGGD